jgi:GH15 family glucan-1,4-alpha-glucosidase
MSNLPIAEHALLSDCHSAAPVTVDGSVDWLCFPRFDSPSVFGRRAISALSTPPGPLPRRGTARNVS